jgi:hypothetical protein
LSLARFSNSSLRSNHHLVATVIVLPVKQKEEISMAYTPEGTTENITCYPLKKEIAKTFTGGIIMRRIINIKLDEFRQLCHHSWYCVLHPIPRWEGEGHAGDREICGINLGITGLIFLHKTF